jgi:hypothetical protein
MTTNLPYEDLTFIQNGEPVSGGTGGNSDGVLNRPLVELQANVKEIRDEHDTLTSEVETARGGEANLDARLNDIDQEILDLQNQSTYEDSSQFETIATQNRDRIPSSFDYTFFNKLQEETFDSTTARNSSTAWTLATQKLVDRTADFANKIALIGNPKNIYVDGYKLNLDQRPEYFASLIADMGAAPSTGSRLDFIFLEVWKEEIKIGQADSVLFPNGAVNFDKGSLTEFNSCTLYTADETGGNYPLYLANANSHGAYVKANDVNIAKFMQNPNNNVVKNGNQYYQLRWRVRTHNGVNSYLLSQAHSDANIKAQGQLATASTVSFNSVENDAGLSRAFDNTLSLDGYVRAVSIAIVHRRNTTAWSLENPNGADPLTNSISAAMHGKFYDHIHLNDVCDLRQHGMFDNTYDYKAMYESNLNEILSCQLTTTFEPLMSDSDGNGVYKDLEIYGTKLLRMEGLVGSVPFDAGWEVINVPTAQNGVKSGFDGIRNYYSDVGGDQVVTALVPRIDQDGVNPTSCFTYVASTKTLTIDATDLKSGNDENPGHASRTKISTRQPHLRWGVSHAILGDSAAVGGIWTGLGGDSASFQIDTTTVVMLQPQGLSNFNTLELGAVYNSPNGVACLITRLEGGARAFATFSGSALPKAGDFTKVSGTGPDTFTSRLVNTTDITRLNTFVVSNDISSLRTGDVYTEPSSSSRITIQKILSNNAFVAAFTHGSNTSNNIGTYNRYSGAGPTTLEVTDIYMPIGYPAAESSRIFGSNVMPTNAPIHVNAYITFAPGSGFMNRIPHNDNNSFIGCHFNVNGEQVLPNGGKGFIPFGSTVDPLNDGNLPVDSHSRTSNLMGFLYKGAVMDIGTEPNGYNSEEATRACVIKDGATYKMWSSGKDNDDAYRILYSTSSDGITWSTPQLVMDIGTEPNGYNSRRSMAPSVIKDGSTYKMWFTGQTASNYRILYSTSSDGITWSTPQLVMDIGTEPNGFTNVNSLGGWVIKDGSTYKMWFSGYQSSSAHRMLYTTSTDGVSWSTPEICFGPDNNAYGLDATWAIYPCVIKEGSIFRMFYTGQASDSVYRNLVANSLDGKSFSNSTVVLPTSIDPFNFTGKHTFVACVIKDNAVYKTWVTGISSESNPAHRILHAVLTMTDTANTGSSLTGVYPTAGSLNCAPPANSQVVVMYEALADQMDRSLIGEVNSLSHQYSKPIELITSEGTGYTSSNARYRDIAATFLYRGAQTSILSGLSYLRKGDIVSNAASSNYSGSLHPTITDGKSYGKINDTFVERDVIKSPFTIKSAEYTLTADSSICFSAGVVTGTNISTSNINPYARLSHGLDKESFYGFLPAVLLTNSKKTLMTLWSDLDDRATWIFTGNRYIIPLGRPILK